MYKLLRETLIAQSHASAQAYVRNLAAAEAAIMRGQFNVAKILRATAHAQRVLALEATRLTSGQSTASELLQANLSEIESALDQTAQAQEGADAEVTGRLKESALVRVRVRELILRSINSLEAHADIMESDVAQSLWGCYQCGYIADGNRPDACPVCGALGAEFEWFGPFYSATPEHLGQLTPAQIIATLEGVPNRIAEIIARADEATLCNKPSEQEWCVKEIAGHMLETDLLFTRRLKTLLDGQGVPDLTTPIPPWKLQEGKGYEHMPVDALLERLRQTRSASLAVLYELKPEAWSRRGTLRGASTSLIDLGTWLANHDQGHSAQIVRLCGP